MLIHISSNPRKPGEKKRRKRRADAAKLTLSPEELAEISDLKLIASIEPCPEVESFDYPTFLDGAGLHFQLRHPAGSLHSERIQTMSAANAPRASKRNTMNVEDNQLMHTVMAKLENGLSAVTPVDNDDSPLAHEPLTETASPLSINTSPDRFDAYEDLSPELNKIFGELCGDESGFNFADIIGSHEWPEDLLEFPLP